MRWKSTAVWTVQDGKTFLTDGRRNWQLQGDLSELFARLKRYCDESPDTELEKIPESIYQEGDLQVSEILHSLRNAKILLDEPKLDPERARLRDYTDAYAFNAALVDYANSPKTVIYCSTTEPPKALVDILWTMHIRLRYMAIHDFELVPADFYLLIQNMLPLKTMLRIIQTLHGKVPVMPILFNGWTLYLGPTTYKSEPCLGCWKLRKKANYSYPESSKVLDTLKVVVTGSTVWGDIVVGPIVKELLAALAPPESRIPVETIAHEIQVNFWSLEIMKSRVFRVPDCPVCGVPSTSGVSAWL